MTEKEDIERKAGAQPEKSAESREERLSAALRANLKRRKAQARSRKSDAPADDEKSS